MIKGNWPKWFRESIDGLETKSDLNQLYSTAALKIINDGLDPKVEGQAIVKSLLAAEEKHLPGMHDQKVHGHTHSSTARIEIQKIFDVPESTYVYRREGKEALQRGEQIFYAAAREGLRTASQKNWKGLLSNEAKKQVGNNDIVAAKQTLKQKGLTQDFIKLHDFLLDETVNSFSKLGDGREKIGNSVFDNYSSARMKETKSWLASHVKTNVKLAPIQVKSGRRSDFSADSIDIAQEAVNVEQQAVHEYGHWVSFYDPYVTKATKSYLKSRASGLTELRGYEEGGGTETAYVDTFIDPYVGRKYPNENFNEVFSMGLQYMNAQPRRFFRLDADFFFLTLGLMSGQHLAVKKSIAESDLDVLIGKHLPGQHDQKKHAGFRYDDPGQLGVDKSRYKALLLGGDSRFVRHGQNSAAVIAAGEKAFDESLEIMEDPVRAKETGNEDFDSIMHGDSRITEQAKRIYEATGRSMFKTLQILTRSRDGSWEPIQEDIIIDASALEHLPINSAFKVEDHSGPKADELNSARFDATKRWLNVSIADNLAPAMPIQNVPDGSKHILDINGLNLSPITRGIEHMLVAPAYGRWLELNNPDIFYACQDFAKSRFESIENAKYIGDDFGANYLYDHDTGGALIEFGNETTNVLSIGLDRLFRDPVDLFKDDTDLFFFTLGIISGRFKDKP